MKATVEYVDEVLNITSSSQASQELKDEFIFILHLITTAEGTDHLRVLLKGFSMKYFKYGFGHRHLWVKSLDPELYDKNIFFVQL